MIECQTCYKPTSENSTSCDNCGAIIKKGKKDQVQYVKPTSYDSDRSRKEYPISIGDWFVTLILLAIPFVNIIYLLVLAFGGSASDSKKNFAKASLILMIPAVIIWGILFSGVFSSLMYF